MTWTVVVAKPAQKQVAEFPAKEQDRIAAAIRAMADDPFSGDIIKLEGAGNRWRRRVSGTQHVTARMIIYQAFIEGDLDLPKHPARRVHDCYFEQRLEDFKPRTLWSLSNALHVGIQRTRSVVVHALAGPF